MYKYIVHVMFPRHVGMREHYVEQRDRHIPVYLTNTSIVCNDLHNEDWTDRDAFYFNKEDEAQVFAQYLATEHPGADVYVAATTAIVTAEIAKPIVKKVTDQGVLPV